jgi:hypothetical protein
MAVKLPVSMFPASGNAAKSVGFVVAVIVLLAIVAAKAKPAPTRTP